MNREKRLLQDGEYENPQWAMAVEEAVLKTVADGVVPDTLRFWRNMAIIIGRFQCPKNEVNLEYCLRYKVALVRRFSGGGTVYQDSGNLNFSIYMRTSSGIATFSKALNEVGKAVVTSLNDLGILAELNDRGVYVRGKKICGLAGTILREAILIHGCLLVDSNVKALYSSLNLKQEGIRRKFTLSRPSEVTTVRNELGKEISINEIEKTLTKFFGKTFQCTFIPGTVTSNEFELTKKLYDQNYSRLQWHLISCKDCPEREKDVPVLKELMLPKATKFSGK
jgi:lipoate-protein ligase A